MTEGEAVYRLRATLDDDGHITKLVVEDLNEPFAKWGDSWETQERNEHGEFGSGGGTTSAGGSQSDAHGNPVDLHGSGGPNEDHWGNWTRANPDEVRQGKIDEMTQRVQDQNKMLAATQPERLNTFVQQQVDAIKPTTDWKLSNGTVVSITNGVRSSPEQQKQLMDTVERLTTKYPPTEDHPPRTFNILDSKSSTKLMGAKADGATIEGGTQVWISPKVFAKDGDAKTAEQVASGWASPAGAGASKIDYVTTHEFGHTLDQTGHSEAVRAVMSPKSRADYLPATSRYGQTNGYERYAEAFTEHELSGGQTTQPLAQALAGPAGWK